MYFFLVFCLFLRVYVHIITWISCRKNLFDPTKVHILNFRANFSDKKLYQGTGHVSRAHLSQKNCFQNFEKNRRRKQLFQKLPLRHTTGYDIRKHTLSDDSSDDSVYVIPRDLSSRMSGNYVLFLLHS